MQRHGSLGLLFPLGQREVLLHICAVTAGGAQAGSWSLLPREPNHGKMGASLGRGQGPGH